MLLSNIRDFEIGGGGGGGGGGHISDSILGALTFLSMFMATSNLTNWLGLKLRK